jgi:excisionase family DNA binding protein
MKTDPLKTTRQVAERLAVNVDKVLGLIHAGELVAIDVSQRAGGRPRYRIDPADLAAFEQRRRVRSPSPQPRRRRRTQHAGIIQFF